MTVADLLHIRSADGRIIGYQVPSESEPGQWHTCTPRWCDCRGFFWRKRCKHITQAAAYVEAQLRPQPAVDVITGLRQMAEARSQRYVEIFGQGG